MILETRNVSKDFGKLAALVDVDLAVAPGEIFGLAGPNGAGKSTLFNVIAGTFPPTAGRIIFAGKDITGLGAHRICHLGLARTFQIPQTFASLSVYDNLRVGATFGGHSDRRIRTRIEESLAYLDLTAFRATRARNLDLYTTKLVMLAACLATGCKLLMLDEPLAGLSMLEINNFLELVRKINREHGTTILMIEHILDSLMDVSHRLLILHNGAVICTGDPQGVCSDPKVIEVYLGEGEDE
ncbi:MAG: ABC transporter ATP-binding protein [Desulfobacterales bacterium]|nr:MAG: ABC transporter ATP-binding protein [Desulfobacterales bacterium]